MNTPNLYDIFLSCPKICVDSRKAESGSIFFALKGENFDGNRYAEIALEKCEYAVVENQEVVKNERYILVDDALLTLQRLATYHRKRLGLPIIAITGTNGKTTTKELIAAVMATKYKVGFTQGNLNNHIGVPLTLLSFDATHEFGIIEMGANHIGEIAQLCKIAAPDFGLITNVGKAHLEGFGSFEGVKKAKSELYQYLHDNDGVAFVNYDNEQLEDMNPPHYIIYYGTKGFTHCQGRIEENGLFLKLRWIGSEDVMNDKDPVDWIQDGSVVQTKLYGKYNFENVLAAICIGNNFNVPDESINQAVENYEPKNNRSQIINTGKNVVILDSYNANPTSMRTAIDNFSEVSLENKLLILGDMFELGETSIREHGVIIAQIKALNFKNVLFVGSNFYNYEGDDDYIFFKTRDNLINYLSRNQISDKNILIKGSRGMGLEKILPVL